MNSLHPILRRLLGRSVAPDSADPTRVSHAQAVLNALWLIEYGNAGTLAYLALPRLRDPDNAVRDAAARCLLALADGRHRPATDAQDVEGRPVTSPDACGGTHAAAPDHAPHALQSAAAPDPRARAAVAETLNQAVVQYGNHRHAGALRAWMAQGTTIFDPEGSALTVLNDPEHLAVSALRHLLKDADGPVIRRGLIGLLGLPTLALAAVAGLRRVAEDGPDALARGAAGPGPPDRPAGGGGGASPAAGSPKDSGPRPLTTVSGFRAATPCPPGPRRCRAHRARCCRV